MPREKAWEAMVWRCNFCHESRLSGLDEVEVENERACRTIRVVVGAEIFGSFFRLGYTFSLPPSSL
jgi:hypothetical protein